ncbi:MAG: DUF6371 domain-containing protein [Paludibacteraceae bacterium]|nr:DUF6371 domain-containing protein [Paludibacteraceae bacterium]
MEFENVINEVRNVSILEVAQRLGISYSGRGSCRMCHCFIHEDENPSLWLKVSGNYWGCPVCQKGGDNIRLVMYHENLKFAQAVRWLAERFGIVIDDARRDNPYLQPKSNRRRAHTRQNVNKINVKKMNLVSLNSVYLKQCYSTESSFCRALVNNNILTEEQMRRAALRYHLGMTCDGGVIYWQIDRNERLHDGKIMFYRSDCHRDHDRHPSWVVSRLKKQGLLPDDYQPSRCLFGSHLLASYLPPLPSEGIQEEGSHLPPLPSEGIQEEGSHLPPHPSEGVQEEGSHLPPLPSEGIQEEGSHLSPLPSEGIQKAGSHLPPHPSEGIQEEGSNLPPHPSEGIQEEGSNLPPHPSEGIQEEGSPNGNGIIVAIVESEKTAIICSELFPKFQLPTGGSELPVVWLATGGLSSLTVSALAQIATVPAHGSHTATVPASSAGGSPSPRLILFPDTDPTGETYRKWQEIAIAAQQELHISVMVSDFLERNATADQKASKIDIADYIMITNK